MTLENAIREWKTKKRRMGCVAATAWLCRRVPSFAPKRLTRYLPDGQVYEHVVATDGVVVIDLAPYADSPTES